MAATLQQFLEAAARRQRVVVIGGLAVIAHGLSRPTVDGDAWLEPCDSSFAWANLLRQTLAEFSGLQLWSLSERRVLVPSDIEQVCEKDGVLRVRGLSTDLDLFRHPHGIEKEEFADVWERSERWAGDVRVIDAVDLILTKDGTGRERDLYDIAFLEGKIRADLCPQLLRATLAEAQAMFARYHDYAVCECAMKNRDPAVSLLARETLRNLASQGDWFARDVLARGESETP